MTTLETRFVRADLIEVYKIFNGLDSLDPGRLSVRDVGVTRGHSFKLFKKRVSLDVECTCLGIECVMSGTC